MQSAERAILQSLGLATDTHVNTPVEKTPDEKLAEKDAIIEDLKKQIQKLTDRGQKRWRDNLFINRRAELAEKRLSQASFFLKDTEARCGHAVAHNKAYATSLEDKIKQMEEDKKVLAAKALSDRQHDIANMRKQFEMEWKRVRIEANNAKEEVRRLADDNVRLEKEKGISETEAAFLKQKLQDQARSLSPRKPIEYPLNPQYQGPESKKRKVEDISSPSFATSHAQTPFLRLNFAPRAQTFTPPQPIPQSLPQPPPMTPYQGMLFPHMEILAKNRMPPEHDMTPQSPISGPYASFPGLTPMPILAAPNYTPPQPQSQPQQPPHPEPQERRIVACMNCHKHWWNGTCDNGTPCQNCHLEGKTASQCIRPRCSSFEAGSCSRRNCSRAHEDDQFMAVHAYKKDLKRSVTKANAPDAPVTRN
ncbi:uncharacterized protein BDR25DRAFT_310566 [Lindgomyces ingoldianus]|uniref:Uncharacterized protein n=1 Tax=Lindgomyces ingoldianus TaxID=673940 RepID=A0ACB6R735_9PLEO|nr:uncharacterized protein BDR25DRAFT_310566 [Lindgomyces ingoldianus]KAF2475114.1 hypothetical protein BDR25DRAFT_310566 [Lindgomyces ingoldianus]